MRNPKGRAAYEESVLATVKSAGGAISAQGVRAAVGGTPAQARTALNRLIQRGVLGYAGRARATTYFLA